MNENYKRLMKYVHYTTKVQEYLYASSWLSKHTNVFIAEMQLALTAKVCATKITLLIYSHLFFHFAGTKC